MKKYQKGQVLLAVLMVMVVALTVGLSVAARTTSNIRTSSEEESSQRAFSAAEAGIERALISGADIPSTNLTNNTSYTTTVSQVSSVAGGGFLLNNGVLVLRDEPIDLWLATPPTYTTVWNGALTISWGKSSDSCSGGVDNTMSALEIVIITTTTPASPKTNNRVTTYNFDPCSDRKAGNNFDDPIFGQRTIDGQTFVNYAIIPVTNGLIARIIPLYAPSVMAVEGSSDLPSQGNVLTSTGVSVPTKRKIVSFRGYPKLPVELFPFIIFSPNP